MGSIPIVKANNTDEKNMAYPILPCAISKGMLRLSVPNINMVLTTADRMANINKAIIQNKAQYESIEITRSFPERVVLRIIDAFCIDSCQE